MMDSDEERSFSSKKRVSRVLFPDAARQRQNQNKARDESWDKAPEVKSSPDTRPFVIQSPEVQAAISRTFGSQAFTTPSRGHGHGHGVQVQSAQAKAPEASATVERRTVSHRRIPRGSGPHGPFKPVIVEAKDNPAYHIAAEWGQFVMSPQHLDDKDEEEDEDGDENAARAGPDTADTSRFVWPDPNSPTPSIPQIPKGLAHLNPKLDPLLRLQRPVERPHGPRPMPTFTGSYARGNDTVEGRDGGGGGSSSTTSLDKPMMMSYDDDDDDDDRRAVSGPPRPGSGGKRSRDEMENTTTMSGHDIAREREIMRRKTVHPKEDGDGSDSENSEPTPKASELNKTAGTGPEGVDEMDVDAQE